jgi:hypothetical protein
VGFLCIYLPILKYVNDDIIITSAKKKSSTNMLTMTS